MKSEERGRLSALLKGLRGESSIRGFCANSSIHYSAWRQWESEESVPGYENLEKVAALKGWSMDQLLAHLREGDETESPVDLETLISYAKGLPESERISLVKRLL